jgi:hypothetical protein
MAYSAKYWPDRLQDALISTSDPLRAKICLFYDVESDLHDLWFPIFWQATRPCERRPQVDSIELVALQGDDKVLEMLLQSDQNYDIDESDDEGRTALI